MATKQIIKLSEARVLVHLNKTMAPFRYMQKISTELRIDYGYLNKIMQGLLHKKWVKRAVSLVDNKRFYNLTNAGLWKAAEAKKLVPKEMKNGSLK